MTMTMVRTYPKHVTSPRSELSVAIRPLEQGDGEELLAFFRRIPEEERFYLKEDVTSSEVIERWVNHIDYRRVLPFVALVGSEIVADATLHRGRAGARRHVGEIRIVVDPRFRNKGLGTLMTREVLEVAYDNGLDNVLFELVEGREDDAISMVEKIGFDRVATIPGIAQDLKGSPQNIVVMKLALREWLDW